MKPPVVIAAALAAFVVSWALVRAWISLAPRLNILDVPNARSSHTRVTPRGGGVGIVATVPLGGISLVLLGEVLAPGPLAWAGGLALFIAAISFSDDLRPLSSVLRLSCHVVAAVLVVAKVGVLPLLTWPWGSPLLLPPWMLAVLTILWIVGLTNVYNFMDGIDGIAGVQAVVAGLAWAGFGWTVGLSDGQTVDPSSVVRPLSSASAIALLLAASAMGFLLHNWSPAKVFMGDVGSAFLGFAFAVLPLLATREMILAAQPAAGHPPDPALIARLGAVPVIAVAVVWPFVGDGFFTFLRRIKHRENVLKPHRSHLYQRLTIVGWSHARVSLLYLGWAVLCAILGGIYLLRGNETRLGVIVALVASVLGLFQLVKRVERRASAVREAARGKGQEFDGDSAPLPLPPSPFLARDADAAVQQRPRLHLSPPHLGSDEFRFVTEAFQTNWVAPAGPHLHAFEREFAALVGVKAAVALDSGTAALHMAMKCVGVRPGDEVFVSTFTFAASANPAIYEGAKPVFIGVEETSWNMDPECLAEALADRAKRGRLPRAVVLVHVYGESADVDRIAALCAQYQVPLVEDAAEAVGAKYKGRYVGTTGLLGVFSFNGNKIITTSGGGMLVSNDQRLVDLAHNLGTQARDPGAHYEHSKIGYNYRLSNVLAGIGRGQLRVLEERVMARRRIFAAYHAALSSLPGLQFMPEAPWGRSTRWLTCLTIDPAQSGGVDRETVRLALEAANIESRPLWKPLHLQPVFQQMGCEIFGRGVSDRLFAQGLCLPSGSAMSEDDINRVVDVVQSCWATSRA